MEELGLDESELLSDSAPPSLPAVAATLSVAGTCTYTDVSPPPTPPLDPIDLSSQSNNITPFAVVILHPPLSLQLLQDSGKILLSQCCTSTKERRVSVTITLYG